MGPLKGDTCRYRAGFTVCMVSNGDRFTSTE